MSLTISRKEVIQLIQNNGIIIKRTNFFVLLTSTIEVILYEKTCLYLIGEPNVLSFSISANIPLK